MSENWTNGNGWKGALATAAIIACLVGASHYITYLGQADVRDDAEAAAASLAIRVSSLESTRLVDSHEDGVADTTRAQNVKDVDQLQDESKALDDRLQREMRDLNAAIIAESRAVDARLQGEISNVNDHLLQLEGHTTSEFSSMDAVLSGRAERITRLEERLRALERLVFAEPAQPDRTEP